MPPAPSNGPRPTPLVARTAGGDRVSITLAGSRIERIDRPDSPTSSVVVPGLTDAHGHVVGLGLSLVRVDLRSCQSPSDCAERVRDMLAKVPACAWIQGRG